MAKGTRIKIYAITKNYGTRSSTLSIAEGERVTRQLHGMIEAYWEHAWRRVHPESEFQSFMEKQKKSADRIVNSRGGVFEPATIYDPKNDTSLPFVVLDERGVGVRPRD